MNILFIIGNGFDINLGLKTRYSDFYSYYKNIKSNSQTINDLKNNIEKRLENWSDLELALGNYTKEVNSLPEFDEIYDDIVDQLGAYLEQEENQFDVDPINLEDFLTDLNFPENYLLPADKTELRDFKNKWESTQWHLNIITFNYTHTIEKILRNNIENSKIGTHHQRYEVYLQRIEHIHGYLDNRMILGVNDKSQIGNTNFHENQDICNAMIKSNYNKVAKQSVHERCVQLINKAHLICIFGSSIGDTDKLWWELIGDRLKEDCRIIIFKNGNAINNRIQHKLARQERELKEHFLSKTNLTQSDKIEVQNKVYLSINSNLFKNLSNKK